MSKYNRISLRLAKDLKQQLRAAAIKHNITINDEIMLRLHDSFAPQNTSRLSRRADVPVTISVPEAGKRYFGLSRNGSYAAAERGDLPTIKVGRKLLVPIDALEQKLERRSGL